MYHIFVKCFKPSIMQHQKLIDKLVEKHDKVYKNKLYNSSFYNKIYVLSLSISLIPIFILGVFSQSLMSKSLIERENDMLSTTLKHEVISLEFKLNTYLQMINLIMLSEDMETALLKDYDNNYEMYLSYRDVVDPMIDNFKFIQPDINLITIYTNNNMLPHSTHISNISNLSEKSWYNEDELLYNPTFKVNHNLKTVELVCQNYNPLSKYKYYVVFDINYNQLFGIFQTLFSSHYGFQILDDFDNYIYHYEALEEPFDIDNINSNNYVLMQLEINNTDWIAYLYRPIKEIVFDSNIVTLPLILMLTVCVVLMIPISRNLAQFIVKPIKNLQQSMAKVENSSYFDINVTYDSEDEIGQLYSSFSTMLSKINYLVNEVLKSKITKQEYEMKALQAQINPHFLYNSLALINNKAIIEEQHHISKIANQLSQFYRTTLNKGKSITTVKDELDNLKAYINIQLIMHDNSFDVIYDLDERLYNYPMPNLTCQPLIENAIDHGIDHALHDDKGVLSISCYEEDDLLVIKIMDNGCGMSKEKCKSILTSKSEGYGVQNVHHRIQLIYGYNYGLEYNSTENFGTRVTIAFPKKIPKSNI